MFYRPGLDALRVFAFISVFIHHTPFQDAKLYAFTEPFGFGMQTFFLLSAYLITELLLREKEKTETVHFRAFYIRRILRIWPLYFLGVFIAVVAWQLDGRYWLGKTRLLGYIFFFVNFVGHGNSPMSHLWSISIEEQFYLVWPAITSQHRRLLIPLISALFVPVAFWVLMVKSYEGVELWYNTFVEFLFFGMGATLAVVSHGRTPKFSAPICALFFTAGISLWFSTLLFGGRASTSPINLCTVYTMAGIGCILIFLAFLALPEHLYPRPVLYLGTISYGLYVYHYPVLTTVLPHLMGAYRANALVNALMIDAAGFLLTIALAACSFRVFESPFLKLKTRFTFIPSRIASPRRHIRTGIRQGVHVGEAEVVSHTWSLVRLLRATEAERPRAVARLRKMPKRIRFTLNRQRSL